MFILDFGSGNTCKNDRMIIAEMIDSLDVLDPVFKKQIIIKWQLFAEAGENVSLNYEEFIWAKDYAFFHKTHQVGFGFKTTSSVFDVASLFMAAFPSVPFIKIANNEKFYYLQDLLPKEVPLIKSISSSEYFRKPALQRKEGQEILLCCVSEYPADKQTYFDRFTVEHLKNGISDHTTNWDLWRKIQPSVYECHYRLKESTGLDAGPFARTIEDLKEIEDEVLMWA